jgi:hypothetical protein
MTRGGPRVGAGRKPRGEGRTRRYVSVNLLEHEEAELLAGLREGETVSSLLRDSALREVRKRKG